ncbi:hypothetical protein Fmac_021224 [Flemingia macrophylla]|uniref:Protein kinase domain-containing protein n=1 Tax=Flemingia macrophylla TaxID=520843 RepID=A0ABD1LWH7_9FABA
MSKLMLTRLLQFRKIKKTRFSRSPIDGWTLFKFVHPERSSRSSFGISEKSGVSTRYLELLKSILFKHGKFCGESNQPLISISFCKTKNHAGHKSNKNSIVGIIAGVDRELGARIGAWLQKSSDLGAQRQKGITDLSTFNFSVIAKATENFSIENKLGEGGFGPVYKQNIFRGTLIDGKEIAAKRLSKTSGQGTYEFKNEVALIAKLQH